MLYKHPQHLASSCYGTANAERFARVYLPGGQFWHRTCFSHCPPGRLGVASAVQAPFCNGSSTGPLPPLRWKRTAAAVALGAGGRRGPGGEQRGSRGGGWWLRWLMMMTRRRDSVRVVPLEFKAMVKKKKRTKRPRVHVVHAALPDPTSNEFSLIQLENVLALQRLTGEVYLCRGPWPRRQ